MVVGSRQSSNDSIFYLCTLLRGKTEGVRDLKSDTSAYLLERVSPSQRGIKSRMFFFCLPLSISLFFFFIIIILCHCAPPSSLKTMHILPGESSNITTLLHRYSSLGPLTFSYPFPTPPLFLMSALPPSPLLICLPIRRPFFSCTSHSLPPQIRRRRRLPSTFTSLPLLWRRTMRSFPLSLLRTLLISHLPSAYASAYFEVVAHNRYSILMRTLMNF